MRNNFLLLDLIQVLFNLFAESCSLFLLAPLLVDFLGVIVTAPFLVLLGHAQDFAELFSNMLDECCSIANESSFNRVNNRAALLVGEPIASNDLQRQRGVNTICNGNINLLSQDGLSTHSNA